MALSGGVGCARKVAPPGVPAVIVEPREAACWLIPGEPTRPGALRIALFEPISRDSAPCPTNDAESLVFRQLYETLVRVDCEGGVHAGLAATWEPGDSGRVWTFTLRAGARWSDGTPVEAKDVVSAWRRNLKHAEVLGVGTPWLRVHPDSVRVMGPDTLSVALRGGRLASPALFSHSWLAVAGPDRADGWVVGSGPYRVSDESTSWSITLDPNPYDPDSTRTKPLLKFTVHEWADPRDFMDAADLLLITTRDQADYAAGVNGFRVLPLAWNRLYALVPAADSMTFEPADWRSFRKQLAGHVMRSEAMPAESFAPYPGGSTLCRVRVPSGSRDRPTGPAGPESHQVAYRAGDGDAEQIAARLVGLFPVESEVPAAVALPESVFTSALRAGEYRGFVISLPRSSPVSCMDADALAARLPWLGARRGDLAKGSGSSSISPEDMLIPLVVTRRQLALRRGILGVRQDWDGTLLLDRAGWSAEAVP